MKESVCIQKNGTEMRHVKIDQSEAKESFYINSTESPAAKTKPKSEQYFFIALQI